VAPSIVFFDEIDALGGARGGGGGSSKVGERVLAQLLTEMDGVVCLSGVIVVAATNRPDLMDRALLRPGRLDRVVYVPLPDLATRRQVLDVHTRNMPLNPDLDIERLALDTEGYSGAEIAAVCNEAALAALEEDAEADTVAARHFSVALGIVTPRIQPELLQIYAAFQRSEKT
jgi:AAA family ATPase